MFTSKERRAAHAVTLPAGYLPMPQSHLANSRDYGHFIAALRWLESIKAKRVLDVGAYDGWLDFLLIDRGFKVTGIEFIEELAQAGMRYADRNMIDYTVFTGAAQNFSFKPNEYDAVICFETLEHVPAPVAMELTYRFAEWAPHVMISLPDQDHNENTQHCWTPTENLLDLWFTQRGADIEYRDWPGTTIPGNWFISYERLK